MSARARVRTLGPFNDIRSSELMVRFSKFKGSCKSGGRVRRGNGQKVLVNSFTDIYPSEPFASIVACLASLEGLGSNLGNILGKTNSEEGSERWPLTGVCPIQMAGGLRESWPLPRRPPSFLSLVFSSAAPLFLKPAPPASVRRPVYPGIPSSRLSAANKAKWKSKQARNPTTGSDSGLPLFQLIDSQKVPAPPTILFYTLFNDMTS